MEKDTTSTSFLAWALLREVESLLAVLVWAENNRFAIRIKYFLLTSVRFFLLMSLFIMTKFFFLLSENEPISLFFFFLKREVKIFMIKL